MVVYYSITVSYDECRDFGETFKRVAKQVQASLPIVGLISRLAAPEGGVGSDMQVG